MANNFSRGREVMASQRQMELHRRNEAPATRGVVILAKSPDGKQKIVGAAISHAGAVELLQALRVQSPGDTADDGTEYFRIDVPFLPR